MLKKKKKIELPCDPAIPLLDTYPKEMKPLSQNAICTPIFPIVLLMTVNIQNKSKCLLTEKWIKKTYFIHMHTYAYTMEYYSDIKKEGNPVIWNNIDES